MMMLTTVLLCLVAITTHAFVVTGPRLMQHASMTTSIPRILASPLFVHHPLSTEDKFNSLMLQHGMNDTMTTTTTDSTLIQNNDGPLDRLQRSTTSLNLEWAQPLSWLALGLAAGCGMASSGLGGDSSSLMETAAKTATTMALVGPCWQGFAQTMDAWYLADKKKQQQQPPQEPQDDETMQVSGYNQEDTKTAMLQQMGILLATGMGLSLGTEALLLPADNHILSQLSLAFYGLSILSTPLTGGWVSAWMIALCTTTLPWMLGHAMFTPVQQPADIAIPILYSMIGLGSVIINDFARSHEDPGIRIRALVPMLDTAKGGKFKRNNYTPRWTAVVVQDSIQVLVAAYLATVLHEPVAAGAVMALLVPQMFTQRSLLFSKLVDVHKAFEFSQPFYLLGMITTAIAMGHAM